MPATFPTALQRCPVCKKPDPCANGLSSCPRCGCDLKKSTAAQAAAYQYTKIAATCLRDGDFADALANATYAWSLAHLPAIPPLACLAALHSRQLADLAIWRTRLATGQSPV